MPPHGEAPRESKNVQLIGRLVNEVTVFLALNASFFQIQHNLSSTLASNIRPLAPEFPLLDFLSALHKSLHATPWSRIHFVHHWSSKWLIGCNLLIKSAKYWTFVGLLGSYWILNSSNLIDHAIIIPTNLGFLNTFAIRKSVLTTTRCLWKYYRRSLVAWTSAKATLSISWYHVSVSCKTLLTK